EAFVTCDEVNVAKNFRNAINRTFSCKGGVLWEGVQDNQLCNFLIKLGEEFWEDGNGDRATKKAALVIGRQWTTDEEQLGNEVYVLNEDVQINANGIAIPKENHQYVLMAPYLKSSCSVPMAVGNPSNGKSTSLQLINKLIGGKFISQTSGESLSAELTKTSVPVCWDDPTHPTTLKKILVSTFQRGGRQTKQGGTELPETLFLLTVNFTLDDDMRYCI
ncbi:Hypothetical predicted protein, partial [Paramuricea clavata]